MTPEEYVSERLIPQINWYDSKSGYNKRRHMRARSLEIICAALIPFLSGYISAFPHLFPLIIGVLGALIAISSGLSSLLQYQANWIKYRTTAESLKKERYHFETAVDPYDGADPFGVLVPRVEALISQENTNWAQYMSKAEKKEADRKAQEADQ